MLTQAEQERLVQTGAGTPMGEYLRRYWHPIAASAMLLEKPVKEIRILGEDLVLFRGVHGELGLIDERCAHRRVQLKFGYPVEEGLRCPYHGWTYATRPASAPRSPQSPRRAPSRTRSRSRDTRWRSWGDWSLRTWGQSRHPWCHDGGRW